jgi:hypothetical protein
MDQSCIAFIAYKGYWLQMAHSEYQRRGDATACRSEPRQ